MPWCLAGAPVSEAVKVILAVAMTGTHEDDDGSGDGRQMNGCTRAGVMVMVMVDDCGQGGGGARWKK